MSQVTTLFSEMERYISESRSHVADGKDISLQSLDANIEKLCNMVLTLTPEDQEIYEPRLQGLLLNLNALGLEMKEQNSLHELPMRRNASVAYKTADSRDNFGKRDEE